jgi:hypothetical protein
MSDNFHFRSLQKKITNFIIKRMNTEALKKDRIIGFREWVSLPFIGLAAIKGKVDTGAKTSSLHAFDIRLKKEGKKTFVHFKVHPIQKNGVLEVLCRAQLMDTRTITDSGGHKERRYVIKTTLIMGDVKKRIELTLTDRSSMKYRMLIGREALDEFYIDPSQSYLTGKSLRQRRFLKELRLAARKASGTLPQA